MCPSTNLEGGKREARGGNGQLQGTACDCDEEPMKEDVAVIVPTRCQRRQALHLMGQMLCLSDRRNSIYISKSHLNAIVSSLLLGNMPVSLCCKEEGHGQSYSSSHCKPSCSK